MVNTKIIGNLRFIQKAVIFHNDTFLILQRSSADSKAPNIWDLPGGNIEYGENPVKAIIREVYEETGLKIKKIKPMVVTNFMQKEIYTVSVVYKTRVNSDIVTISSEHQSYKWVDKISYQDFDMQYWIKERLTELI